MIDVLARLRGLPDAGWATTTLPSGVRLFRQGDPVDAVHIVESGALRVLQESVPIGTVGPGESVGESSVFFAGETRSGDAIALSDCVLRTLTRADARRLRTHHPATYDTLLAAALDIQWERLHHIDSEIAALGEGGSRAATLPAGALAKLYRRFRETVLAPPDVRGSLRRIPVLGWAPDSRDQDRRAV